ncbi:hypothetical protein [Geoglobus acetivorans]|uniref:hypothetical protein n=1 Tax=Geoglobus acetivorans TaxID=565033 RepID=UPI00064F176C
MLESRVHSELYSLLANHSWSYQGLPVSVKILRAKQVVDDVQFPAIFIDYGDASLDSRNTPINEILSIDLIPASDGLQDYRYEKGVVVKQSINLNLYDNDLRRIAELQEQLFLLCKTMNLTGVTVFQVNPPRILDFTEEGYIYRRLVEVVCKFVVSYEEIYKTIEDVETGVQVQ